MRRIYQRLEQLVTIKHAEMTAGTIWIPEAPVDLEELADLIDGAELASASDADEIDEEGGVFYRLMDSGHITTLLYLEWSLGAPIAWEYHLSMLDVGTAGAYMLHVPDQGAGDPALVIARLQPGNSPALVEAFVTEFIGTNGAPYHVQIFGGLPNEISIHRPDLISRDAVAAGLRHYASQEDMAWSDMAKTVDMLERRQYLSFGKPNEPGSQEGAMTDEERQAILERYLNRVVKNER